MPGCNEPAGYRAPKSRTELNQYRWFCLEHVRAYNLAWDFYKGMTPGQIEAQIRADSRWQRPSWPLGHLGSAPHDADRIADPFGLLDAARVASSNERRAERERRTPAELLQPLDALGLAWPVSIDEVKSRYKDLAKLNHPDANNGDRDAEERLKSINLAYSALKRHFSTARAATSGQSAAR